MESKAIGIALQLIAEVTISGCRSRRNNSYALCKHRQFQFLVQGEHTLLLQLHQDFPPTACHVAQCIRGVYINHRQAITVEFVELHRHLHQYFDAGHECLSCLPFEVGFQQAEYICPDSAACLCYEVVASRVFLYELQITVSGGVATHIAQFSLHPILAGHTSAEHLTAVLVG